MTVFLILMMQFPNGFTFLSPDEQGLNNALDYALDYNKNNQESWEQLVEKVMRIAFSWESSASQYEELYARSRLSGCTITEQLLQLHHFRNLHKKEGLLQIYEP